jgi:hypothetical protein
VRSTSGKSFVKDDLLGHCSVDKMVSQMVIIKMRSLASDKEE